MQQQQQAHASAAPPAMYPTKVDVFGSHVWTFAVDVLV
jgi:hypothetical protein